MKQSIDDLNKAFESRVRLGIMSVLAVNDALDFSSLKQYLEVTDGNLATHLKTLEKEGFIGVEKSFIDRKPNTKYSLTEEGRKAFNDHLKAMEVFINAHKL
ncbi:MAG: transcriptional regulator [Ignavibacteriales bacterium]|nr:transcriptional regulator [Ignavibacteriales bacterium]